MPRRNIIPCEPEYSAFKRQRTRVELTLIFSCHGVSRVRCYVRYSRLFQVFAAVRGRGVRESILRLDTQCTAVDRKKRNPKFIQTQVNHALTQGCKFFNFSYNITITAYMCISYIFAVCPSFCLRSVCFFLMVNILFINKKNIDLSF